MLYTAITNGFDPERNDIKVFSAYNRFTNPVLNAKIYKVLSHLFINEDYSVWVDGNVYVNVPEKKLIKEFLNGYDIAIFKHPYRDSIYAEAETCKTLNKDNPEIIDEQISKHPNISGLAECGVIIRRHTKEIKRLNEKWWAEICRYSVRDQLSFPYIFPRVNYISGDVRNHPYFKYVKHTHS